MNRSLRTRLILMTLVTGIAGVFITGAFVRLISLREFDRLRIEQARANFTEDVTAHYEQYGTLTNLHLRGATGGPGNSNRNETNRPSNDRNTPPNARPPMFVLVDERGRALHNAGGDIRTGRRLPPNVLENTTPLEIDGEVIGYIALMGGPAQFSQQELVYLERTNRALIAGAVGGASVSVLLGIVMARYLLRPLRELTTALRAVDTDGPGQQLPVRTRDELGELTASFNRMSTSMDRANRLREQMTADIAHDLRTPLTVISGYLEGLRDGTLQPTAKRFETMHNEALYLTGLIEDLRTLSLADAGALTLNREMIAMEGLLQQVAHAFARTAQESGITLAVHVDDEASVITVDESQFRRVLSNLVSNAVRYTPSGERISLTAQCERQQIRIAVADTGTGIVPEKLPDIFERFYRADSARDLNHSASGLGLAIAKSIVEAHGGTIGADSTPGSGTTVYIVLPL
ncbi:MAG: HAMP domain-containing sensor histidine kinase [Chloroflexota bacterium]